MKNLLAKKYFAKKIKKISGILLVALLFCAMLPTSALAQEAATIRVKLSNANDGTINVAVRGQYTIQEQESQNIINSDFTVKVDSNDSNKLIIISKSSGQELFRGQKATFTQQAGSSGTLKLYTSVNSTNGYLGNICISVASGKFTVINTLPIEKYLYGVVAYEMNNNFPLEALKAQAIAARGYAVTKANKKGTYDLLDTPQDQVYKGYDGTKNNAIQAVNETAGEVMTYNNKTIVAFYSASNGGQTDLTKNVWNEALPYYDMRDDPYDVRNKESLNQKVFFPDNIAESTTKINPKLVTFIQTIILPQLKAAGFSTYADQIELIGFKNVQAFDSKYAEPSRNYRKVKGTVEVRAVKADGKAPIPTTGEKTGTKPIEPIFIPTGEIGASGPLFLDGNGLIVTYEEMQIALDQYNAELDDYENGYNTKPGESGAGMTGDVQTTSVNFEFTIFDLKDKLKPYKLFTKPELRIFYTEPTDGGVNLINARFGHGIGMSQRGAQQMASEGLSYTDILSFYYPGTKLTPKTSSETTEFAFEIEMDLDPTTASIAKLTIDKGDQENQAIQEAGVMDDLTEQLEFIPESVQALTTQAKTNITQTKTSKKIIATVNKNTTLHILSQTDDFYKVATSSGKIGYVNISQVNIKTDKDLVVAKAKNNIVLTQDANYNGQPVQLIAGESVNILSKDNDSYTVLTQNNQTGYVKVNDLEVLVDSVKIALDSSKYFGQAKQTVIVYKEKTLKTKVSTLPVNYVVQVINKANSGKAYSVAYSGNKKGYVDAKKIKMLVRGADHPNPSQIIKNLATTISNPSNASQGTGTITGVTINLRAKASKDSAVIKQLAKGEVVTVIEQSGSFMKVKTKDGKTGFVSSEFVSTSAKKTSTSSSSSASGSASVSGVTVRLRKTASKTAPVITTLPKGEKLTILSESGDFYKVETSKKTVGFIAKELVSSGSGSSSASSSSGSKAVAVGLVLAENVNLRQSASGDSKILSVLKKSTKVEIYAKTKDYYKVSVSGTTGYILKSFVGNLKSK